MFQAVVRMKAQLVRFFYVIAFLLVATYAVVTLTGPKGVSALFEKQRRIRALEKSNTSLATEIDRRQQRIRRLNTDQEAQDLVIQEKLRYADPGAKVYMLPDAGKK